jgi:hypothetical protein
LPNPIVDLQEIKGVWTPVDDHWENKARFDTDLTAEELKGRIAGIVTKYYKWSPREKTAEKSGKSLWAFRDAGTGTGPSPSSQPATSAGCST